MSKGLNRFARECVNEYARFDSCDRFYTLYVYDLPDFVQHEFAALILASNENYASEATGPDNHRWEGKMRPALTKYLANSTDKDAQIEFTNTWRDCVTAYTLSYMQELIESALHDYNDDGGYTQSPSQYYGVHAQ